MRSYWIFIYQWKIYQILTSAACITVTDICEEELASYGQRPYVSEGCTDLLIETGMRIWSTNLKIPNGHHLWAPALSSPFFAKVLFSMKPFKDRERLCLMERREYSYSLPPETFWWLDWCPSSTRGCQGCSHPSLEKRPSEETGIPLWI